MEERYDISAGVSSCVITEPHWTSMESTAQSLVLKSNSWMGQCLREVMIYFSWNSLNCFLLIFLIILQWTHW